MSGQMSGKAVIRVDGSVLATENQATLTMQGVNRSPERHGGETYFTEEETAPLMECSVLITKDTNIAKLNDMTNVTVFFEADTGQQFVMRNAFTTEPLALDSSGKTPLKMSAESVDQI
ncbi:MAG: phage tail tube protein [Methylophaga sp.]|nr:phage tail tube protein [Methylophaga sp.]